MAMKLSTGQFHAFKTWDQPAENSMAILDLYIYFRIVKMTIKSCFLKKICFSHYQVVYLAILKNLIVFFCQTIKTEGLFSLVQLFSYLIKRFYDLWLFYDLWCIVFQPLIYGYTTIWPKFRKVGKSNKLSGRKADTQLYGICSRKREGHSITTVPARLQVSAR